MNLASCLIYRLEHSEKEGVRLESVCDLESVCEKKESVILSPQSRVSTEGVSDNGVFFVSSLMCCCYSIMILTAHVSEDSLKRNVRWLSPMQTRPPHPRRRQPITCQHVNQHTIAAPRLSLRGVKPRVSLSMLFVKCKFRFSR